ncbi:RNA polymerase sigma factor [Bacillus niameyensis]|uniref:RNA polymerase sigma factor n=1 Tax=Bacillus niameyensis TaxID=1522308 RepID=UPI00078504B1|nr:RNA polymerase sigma factor [Bacillus niameyensis]
MYNKKERHLNMKADNEKAFFEMYYQKVYQTAYFIVKDQYLAQDITQETFLKAFQSMDTLQDQKKMGAWLATIATRTAIDFIRMQKNRNDIPTEDVYIDVEIARKQISSSVEEVVEKNILKNAIRKNIAELKPPEYREVLLLKYEYELRDEEIAKHLGVSVGAVKSRLHRARKRLKTVLSNQKEIRKW